MVKLDDCLDVDLQKFRDVVQGQLLKIWHRMLIYHTAWICGPYEVNFRKIIVGHFSNDL